MTNAVAALQREVLDLRAQGLSFSQIAEKRAISKSYCVKLARSSRGRSKKRAVTGHTCFSVRERKFAAGLLAGKTQRQAALEAGAPTASADVWASNTVRNPNFRKSFDVLLEQAGLGDEQLVETLADLVDATKIAAAAIRDGRITDILEVPNYEVQLRALELAFRLLGRLGPQKKQKGPVKGGDVVCYLVPDKEAKEGATEAPLPLTSMTADDQHVTGPPGDPQSSHAASC